MNSLKLICICTFLAVASGCTIHFGAGGSRIGPATRMGRVTHVGVHQVLPEESTSCPAEFRSWDVTCR